MTRFVLGRLLNALAVLFAVSVLVFLIFNVIPANPARQIAGKQANATLVANIEEEWGFDKSLPEQYVSLMGRLLSGDLTTYEPQISVSEQILAGVPATLSLTIGAAIIWLGLGILFGYVSARRAGGWIDRLFGTVSVLGISIPSFLIAPLFIYFFAEQLGWLPNGQYVPLTEDPAAWFTHLLLPWLTIAIGLVGFYSNVLRANMLSVMDEDYVRTARAKGLSERRVMTRHVLRNSLIPIVTLFGLDFAAVVGGAGIIVEVIYSINGVGGYFAEALGRTELPAILGVTIYGAVFVVLVNTAIDIAYAFLDPRARTEQAPSA